MRLSDDCIRSTQSSYFCISVCYSNNTHCHALLSFLQGEMLATSEQDFLNAYFKDHYFLIPIDYIMKHRRMVKERKLWVSTRCDGTPRTWQFRWKFFFFSLSSQDENRVHGYHMNGSPKPWEPQWRTACAYPKVRHFIRFHCDFPVYCFNDANLNFSFPPVILAGPSKVPEAIRGLLRRVVVILLWHDWIISACRSWFIQAFARTWSWKLVRRVQGWVMEVSREPEVEKRKL